MADDSDSSGLSEHSDKEIQKLAPIFRNVKNSKKLMGPSKAVSPPKPKRSPSPPHEEVLADNPDVAFLTMFRSRFQDVMPGKLAHFGPQDIERGVVDPAPSKEVEQLLCALLALVLNRKKPVERGHHGRALEEAVLSQKAQWPYNWNGANPLHGGKNFENMTPSERLNLLRTLTMWALDKSEAVQAVIKDRYKQQRHNDDENQPLSVTAWGVDGHKRHYFLIQGMDDTSFRVYREGDRFKKKDEHWYSMAGDIEEIRTLAQRLEEKDGTQAARRLAQKMMAAIPIFEASEEKRRKKEYRQARRAAFTRPEPGFSLYEGRTRGKRMRYTYDDDEAFLSDDTSTRRSARQSNRSTPFETGPTVTASGRQVRQPRTGEYGESLLSAPPISTDELAPGYSGSEGVTPGGRSGSEDSDDPVRAGGRSTRYRGRSAVNGASNPRKRKHIDGYNDIDEMSEEEDANASDDGWDSDKNAAEDDDMPRPRINDDDEDMSEADDESEEDDVEVQSMVVRLKVSPEALSRHVSAIASRTATPLPSFNEGPANAGRVALNDSAQAGAPSHEPAVHPQPISSPIGPSAYPTPTSTSFGIPETKATIATLPTISNSVLSIARPVVSSMPVVNGTAKVPPEQPTSETLSQVKDERGQAFTNQYGVHHVHSEHAHSFAGT